jgi:hypothetical protein
MKRSILLLAFAASACGHSARDGGGKAGVYFVPRSALASLTGSGVEVVGTHDSGLLVRATSERVGDVMAASPESFAFDAARPEFTGYNFASMERKLRDFVATYPELATLDTYGTSRGGRPEYVLTIGEKSDQTPKPELMITAATHGNEVITVDVVLGLMEKLLTEYGSDPRVTAMVKGHTLHFVPAVCVDSYVAQTRANEGRDPNRDYPWPDRPIRSPVGCIRDIMAYTDARTIAGSIDYHAAASMIMFPWAYTYDHIPQADYDSLDDLTTRMARDNAFAHGDIASTIYIAEGSSADYYYWKKHTRATAVEVSHNLALEALSAAPIVEENVESTWTFIEDFH